jgi:hypothetical protein
MQKYTWSPALEIGDLRCRRECQLALACVFGYADERIEAFRKIKSNRDGFSFAVELECMANIVIAFDFGSLQKISRLAGTACVHKKFQGSIMVSH